MDRVDSLLRIAQWVLAENRYQKGLTLGLADLPADRGHAGVGVVPADHTLSYCPEMVSECGQSDYLSDARNPADYNMATE